MTNGAPLVFSFLAGILAFLSPCIIPMITVYLTLITGMTMEELTFAENKVSIKKDIIIDTALFILGFGIIFTLAGGAAGFVGKFLRSYTAILNQIGGVLVIFLGLHLAGIFKLKFLNRLNLAKKFHLSKKPVGYVGSFLVGIFFAIVCSHCIGPLLYSLLIYAGTTGSVYQGMAGLALFSAGLAVPYLITALAITAVLDYLERLKKFLWLISLVSGTLLVFFGILMVGNRFLILTEFFTRLLPYKVPSGM